MLNFYGISLRRAVLSSTCAVLVLGTLSLTGCGKPTPSDEGLGEVVDDLSHLPGFDRAYQMPNLDEAEPQAPDTAPIGAPLDTEADAEASEGSASQ